MNRTIITAKDETGCVYLQCDCGNEIIKVYHYPLANSCEEILLMDYIGGIPDPELIKYKHVDMLPIFDSFIETLENCYNENYYTTEFRDCDRKLVITRDESKFTKIELFYIYENKKKIEQKELVWDIHVRLTELQEFIKQLKELKEKITEVNNNATTDSK